MRPNVARQVTIGVDCKGRLGVKGYGVVPVLAATGSSAGHAGDTPAWNATASAHKRRQASSLVRQFSDSNPLVEGRHELCPAYGPSGLAEEKLDRVDHTIEEGT